MIRPAAVAFDLDGTLIDSAPDIAAALNHALDEERLPGLDLDVVRGMIGDGVRALILKALRRGGMDEEGGARVQRMFDAFQAFAARHPVTGTTIYPGMDALLVRLEARGVRLAVVTNKTTGLAERILDRLDLARRFDIVIGGDGPWPLKPDPAGLLAALDGMGAALGASRYVGDMVIDLRTARAAGVGFVGVDHGHWDRSCPELAGEIPALGAAGLAARLGVGPAR